MAEGHATPKTASIMTQSFTALISSWNWKCQT